MLDKIFKGIFDSEYSSVISLGDFMLCIGVALVLGILLALAFAYKSRFTKSFVTALALLPAIVCVVIMMVNGNIGAGVAVAGAFSLVRFRSAQGTAREITAIFMAMGSGLVCGMGYLAYATLFTVIMCVLFAIYNRFDLGASTKFAVAKTLKITIPEDLDYTNVFDDIFTEYTSECNLIKVKSTNMGSMFRLEYNIILRDGSKEKEFIDKLRTRNGNLEIMVSREQTVSGEL
ncbi:MAG: DUF4956 domain-containing protein [Clostridia bacterium]|nr:DUF4956 domain-containing protein [Clostridia bacterium]